MNRRLIDLCRDTRGTSLIEAAFILPILALMSCGTADVALAFAAKIRAQQAAERAIQFALNAGLTTATASIVQNEATSAAGTNSAVTVAFWLECNKVVQADFNATCPNSSPARYVSVTVVESYQPLFTKLFSATPIPLKGFAEGRIQ
jgi:Flp pilus assembly protein TadG